MKWLALLQEENVRRIKSLKTQLGKKFYVRLIKPRAF